jgi:TatD DNase family protein
MAGLHPTSVKEDFEAELLHVRRRLEKGDFVAVGEIGMDLYWDRTYEEQQREVLRCQMLWAEEFGLPVALHIRKAHNEVFALLRDLNRATYRGVMHCFGGSLQEAQRAVEMGFMLGIGGVVTFKNATMAEVARVMPLDRLLLETDAPYLSPVPHRGQRNESSYIPLIAQKIADLRGITIEEVAEQTTANARILFGIK